MGSFTLAVEKGQFTDSEILVLLGENGTGKTTFIRMLAGNLPADEGSGELKRLLATGSKVYGFVSFRWEDTVLEIDRNTIEIESDRVT